MDSKCSEKIIMFGKLGDSHFTGGLCLQQFVLSCDRGQCETNCVLIGLRKLARLGLPILMSLYETNRIMHISHPQSNCDFKFYLLFRTKL